MSTVSELRARALAHTLFEVHALGDAIVRLGFVQADPIRAPARAQDLILRQRVSGYREGDLEKHYESLRITEDYLYAYGFLPREVASFLHPRAKLRKLTALDREVLAAMRDLGVVHPRDLDARFAQKRVVNAWGGYSRATKRALERLHHYGLVYVAGRRNGVRLYQVTSEQRQEADPTARMRALIGAIANVLAPISSRTLHALSARLQRWIPKAENYRSAIASMVQQGVLAGAVCEGVRYLWPATSVTGREPDPARVRLLAPFDPLVWDRARFEHLWGWPYRFEAYTPVEKRVRGYYALPLAWGDAIIGWANVARTPSSLEVDLGFVTRRPRDRRFTQALEAEIERLRSFLRVGEEGGPGAR